MDKKPVATLYADKAIFSVVESAISESLPQEPIEWRRSYGRPSKIVCVEVRFLPFSEEVLPVELERNLIEQPLFHIFWTDCNDLDTYKTSVKDELSSWLMKLKARNISDWLIVVATSVDPKKTNKSKLLSRGSVFDKIKYDFGGKSNERCVSIADPMKSEYGSSEAWRSLMFRIRELMLQAYNRQLVKFEENMRAQREKRNEATWNFCNFFVLQEELVFVFEMLGLYEDALVQYDELDALFTEFVLNSNTSETPEWLNAFIKPCDFWDGLSLSKTINEEKRLAVIEGHASLLDLHNYLFSRQCALLLLLCRPWEIAQRSIPFMHNCINELQILEISMPPGSVACWVFLSCLEVLQTCERFNDSAQVEAYSLYTASLWAYAREKLHQLGILCGLMPDEEATSQQLHLVVGLLSGIKQESNLPGPMEKLQEALSSKEAFQRHYLEMSELAMGTYKHIGRIRSARLIGRDLGMFYLRLKEPEKAIVFLTDALKTYKKEQWDILSIQIQLDIANCQKVLGLFNKYVRSCAQIASSKYVQFSLREEHFNKMLEIAERQETIVRLRAEDSITLQDVKLIGDPVIVSGSPLTVNLEIVCHLPKQFTCQCISISVQEQISTAMEIKKAYKTIDNCNSNNVELEENIDYIPERSLNIVKLTCTNVKQPYQKDNFQILDKDYDIKKGCFTNSFKSHNIIIQPGINMISLTTQMEAKGTFILGQLCLESSNIEFILEKFPLPELTFQIVCESPSVSIKPSPGDLVAGVHQKVEFQVNSGSFSINQGTRMKLASSSGLLFVLDNYEEVDMVDVKLPALEPFHKSYVSLMVISKLNSQAGGSIEHKTLLETPWSSETQEFHLTFIPAFTISHNLLTAGNKKFLQILFKSSHQDKVQLTEALLTVSDDSSSLKLLTIPIHSKIMLVSMHQSVSYMWQLEGCEPTSEPINFEFSVLYQWQSSDPQLFNYHFNLKDFVTLYIVKSRVEPGNGVEFCRAGSLCNLHISIIKNASLSDPDVPSSLLYEIVAEQNAWNVFGKTTGRVNVGSTGCEEVTLNVMPLIGGYLPLPGVKLAKYFAADIKSDRCSSEGANNLPLPRLESFGHGQVFNCSQAVQVHVLPALNTSNFEISIP